MPSKYEMSILVMRFHAVNRSMSRSLGRKSDTDVFFLIWKAGRAKGREERQRWTPELDGFFPPPLPKPSNSIDRIAKHSSCCCCCTRLDGLDEVGC